MKGLMTHGMLWSTFARMDDYSVYPIFIQVMIRFSSHCCILSGSTAGLLTLNMQMTVSDVDQRYRAKSSTLINPSSKTRSGLFFTIPVDYVNNILLNNLQRSNFNDSGLSAKTKESSEPIFMQALLTQSQGIVILVI